MCRDTYSKYHRTQHGSLEFINILGDIVDSNGQLRRDEAVAAVKNDIGKCRFAFHKKT